MVDKFLGALQYTEEYGQPMLIAKHPIKQNDPQDYPITFKNNLESLFTHCKAFMDLDIVSGKRSYFDDLTGMIEGIQRVVIDDPDFEN